MGVRARFHFHPKRGAAVELPFEVVEKPVAMPDGSVQLQRVKVYSPVPGQGVDPEVRPSCLNERIRLDHRSGMTRTD